MIKPAWINYCRANHEEGCESMSFTAWLSLICTARMAVIDSEEDYPGWNITLPAQRNF